VKRNAETPSVQFQTIFMSWAIILAWGLNHQLMQAMLAIQIRVDVEFPVFYLYTREDESRPYIIK
jgi:hypothetical protein